LTWLILDVGPTNQFQQIRTAADSAIASSVRGVTGTRLGDKVCSLPQLGQIVAPIGISHEQAMQLVISSFITPPLRMTASSDSQQKKRLAPRVCRRSCVLGSAQIAENLCR
jgi:hypothetical protein